MRFTAKLLKPVLLASALVLAVTFLPPFILFLWFLIAVRALKGAPAQPIQKPYRGGSVSVSPEKVAAGGKPREVTIAYRVGKEGISEGGAIRLCKGRVLRFQPNSWRLCLQWASGWGELQGSRRDRPNFLEVETSRRGASVSVSMMRRAVNRTQLRWLKRKFLQKCGVSLEPFDPRDAFIENQKITVTFRGESLQEGDTVEFGLGAGRGLELPYCSIATDFALEVDPAGTGHFFLEEAVPTLRAVGGIPERFDVVAPTSPAPGEVFRVLVRCLDGRGELSPWFQGKCAVRSDEGLDTPDSVTFASGNEGVACFLARAKRGGVSRIRVRSTSGNIAGESNPVVCGSSWRFLWGDLHTHSLVSDGTHEPWYYYYRARELEGWDFTCVPDHDIWSLAEEHCRTPEEFELMVRAAEDANREGEFVTFPCFEWTEHRLGHRNVLFGPGEKPVFLPSTSPGSSTPELLFRSLSGKKAIVIPHHPAWKTHRGEMRYDWGPTGEPLQRLVEVYSTHGCSEYYGCPFPISHVSLMEGARGRIIRAFLGNEFAGEASGSYVRDALAAGHRLGLIAGSDDHLVGVDPHKSIGVVYRGGLTGILAGAVTRGECWDALYNRRVCGTTGARIFMELRVNGWYQGSEITSDSAPHLTASVVCASNLSFVELVKYDDESGYSLPVRLEPIGSEAVVDYTDRSFRRSSFYYLRVVQADGHIGWAGPVWVARSVQTWDFCSS